MLKTNIYRNVMGSKLQYLSFKSNGVKVTFFKVYTIYNKAQIIKKITRKSEMNTYGPGKKEWYASGLAFSSTLKG